MLKRIRFGLAALPVAIGVTASGAAAADAAVRIDGEVESGGGAAAQSTVTLWAASAGAPTQLGQARTDAEGGFALSVDKPVGAEASLYLVAAGGTPTAGK